jgi:fatty acid kinase fatty acid binding subunit
VAESPFRSEPPGRAAPGPVAVVTDSSASLPRDLDRSGAVTIVPLRVLAGDLMADDDDAGLSAALDAAAERDGRPSTARPAPARFSAAYRAAARAGAGSVLSVHLSGLLSGTVSSAALAAASAPVPVRVVDGRGIGTGLGLVVLAAVAAAQAGARLDEVAAAAAGRAQNVGSYFAVDDPDALLAGGRLVGEPSSASQRAAQRLVSRTVLRVRSGRVGIVERVRTRAAAGDLLARLATDLAISAAASQRGDGAVDVAVEHTSAPRRAAELADRLADAIPQVGRLYVTESSPAIRVHTGLGMVGVSVAPCLADS